MNPEILANSMKAVAGTLRPAGRSPYISLIKLANKFGISVKLILHSSTRATDAQIDLDSSHPTIFVYRNTDANGSIEITPHQEHILTPRERFSIAHELGHGIAFFRFNVLPLSSKMDKSTYWQHERCMNQFAEALLVPRWLSRHWLASVPREQPVAPMALKAWATGECGISSEVVARALAANEPTIGFLKVALGSHVRTAQDVLVVKFCSQGTALDLPKQNSHIFDQRLSETLRQSYPETKQTMSCVPTSVLSQDLVIAWRQANLKTSTVADGTRSNVRLTGQCYWLSVRKVDKSKLKKEFSTADLWQ